MKTFKQNPRKSWGFSFERGKAGDGAPEFFYYALADGIQKLFTRFGKWSAKLDLKKVLLKPSPQLEFAFVDGDG